MKKNLAIAMVLALVMLVTLALPVYAGRPTQKFKYAHSSDCVVVPGGIVTSEYYAPTGDRNSNQGSRMVVKFPLGGVNINRMVSAEIQLWVVRSYVNNGFTTVLPLPNIGLGSTEVIHIADYGRTVSSTLYNAPSIGNDPGELIGATESLSSNIVSVDVTDAVTQAKLAGDHFVAFLIKTAIETDNDSKEDAWYFATSESNKPYRPKLMINLQP